MESTLSIRRNTKRKTLSRAFFLNAKNTIVGTSYELSLVFCGTAMSHKYNKEFRGKDKPTNILSFPLTKKSGEILIDLVTSKKDASGFSMDERTFVGFLYIHGLLHLKGYAHGSTMERLEKKYFKAFFPNKKIPYV